NLPLYQSLWLPRPARCSGTTLTSEDFSRELSSKGQATGAQKSTNSILPFEVAFRGFLSPVPGLGTTAARWSPLLACSDQALRCKQMVTQPWWTLLPSCLMHVCIPDLTVNFTNMTDIY
ncbi:mCG1036165, isoform CRA_b, partial [Mus musculus]